MPSFPGVDQKFRKLASHWKQKVRAHQIRNRVLGTGTRKERDREQKWLEETYKSLALAHDCDKSLKSVGVSSLLSIVH